MSRAFSSLSASLTAALVLICERLGLLSSVLFVGSSVCVHTDFALGEMGTASCLFLSFDTTACNTTNTVWNTPFGLNVSISGSSSLIRSKIPMAQSLDENIYFVV